MVVWWLRESDVEVREFSNQESYWKRQSVIDVNFSSLFDCLLGFHVWPKQGYHGWISQGFKSQCCALHNVQPQTQNPTNDSGTRWPIAMAPNCHLQKNKNAEQLQSTEAMASEREKEFHLFASYLPIFWQNWQNSTFKIFVSSNPTFLYLSILVFL